MEEKMVGRTFGDRYKIIKEVGSGGMSSVFGAYDPETTNVVALKMLDLGSCQTEKERSDAERRFNNEIEVMSMLSHPNIVNYIGRSGEGEPPYFIMEYVEANNLKSRIGQVGALDFKETIYYTKQILKALMEVHSKNVIHCDVKPQNVMLLDDGSIKLADFGIATFENSPYNTESDTVVGTAYYISPEQASGKKLDPRTDIYSLGVMMYEMATGKLPFSAEDTASVSRMHLEVTPRRPRVLDPEIPTGLEQIILHAMEKVPFMRFSDAKAMYDAVCELEKDPDMEFEFNLPPEQIPGHVKAESKPRINGWMLASVGIAAALVIALVVAIIVISTSGKNRAGTLPPAASYTEDYGK